jgi:hypothetical protein
MSVFLLLLHGLLAVALLGALTHQAVALLGLGRSGQRSGGFVLRYTQAGRVGFAGAVAILYVLCFVLGAVIYPYYRLDVRIPFEEMGLFSYVGWFEIKEHWGGIGVGLLPLYLYAWKAEHAADQRSNRMGVTWALMVIVWSDFIIGHFLNNTRGI